MWQYLFDGLCGIEKESLCVMCDGMIVFMLYLCVFGLVFMYLVLMIDYFEVLIELIMFVECDVVFMFECFDDLYCYVYVLFGDEMLWNDLMLGLLLVDDQILIVDYGMLNIGCLKMVYWCGFVYCYGCMMQCIVGIYYNYLLYEEVWWCLYVEEGFMVMFVDYQLECYFVQICNFCCCSWLLMYLFGVLLVFDIRFLCGKLYKFDMFDVDMLYWLYVISLWMSDFGYLNMMVQVVLYVDYNMLFGYFDVLLKVVSELYLVYEVIGMYCDGEWIQINMNVLQIENEFYLMIWLKCVMYLGEWLLYVFVLCGVQYIEVCCFDIDLFELIGIVLEIVCFIDVFLFVCVFDESVLFDCDVYKEVNVNFGSVMMDGCKLGFMLMCDG